MTITINRCNALPVVREPNCIYIVKDGASNDAIIYITGNDAAVINKTLTRSEVADLISDNGRGIVTVSELPAPSALLAGRLMCLAATSVPYWCTGTAWVDITAISDQAQFDSLQAQITSLNSNKQSVSDKDKSGGYAGLTGLMINFRNAVNTITSFFTNSNTAARTYTFKDRNGIIADDTDLAAKANLDSPQFSGNVGVGTAPKTGTQAMLHVHQYRGVQAGMFMSNLDYYNGAFRSPFNSLNSGFYIGSDANFILFFSAPPNSGSPDAAVAAHRFMAVNNIGTTYLYNNVIIQKDDSTKEISLINDTENSFFYGSGHTYYGANTAYGNMNIVAGNVIAKSYLPGGVEYSRIDKAEALTSSRINLDPSNGAQVLDYMTSNAGSLIFVKASLAAGAHGGMFSNGGALYIRTEDDQPVILGSNNIDRVYIYKDRIDLTIPLNLKAYRETHYELTGTVISANNGTIQTKTLTANTTLTETLVSGESVILAISDGAGYTLTIPAVNWVKAGGGGTAPTLHNTLNTWIVLWKVGTTLYGAYLGDA